MKSSSKAASCFWALSAVGNVVSVIIAPLLPGPESLELNRLVVGTDPRVSKSSYCGMAEVSTTLEVSIGNLAGFQ